MKSINPEVQGPFCRISYEPINLNSHEQVKDYLFSQGWVPTEWNTKKVDGKEVKTSPKLTEDSFDSVEGEVPKLVTERAVLLHRQRLLKNTRKDGEESGLLNLIRDDGRIEAGSIPNATPTGRYRHFGVVNIPNAHATYGSEIRSLFTVPDGYDLIGVDAKALEARIFAHYVLNYEGGDVLADIIMNGDIHSENASLWGCSRNDAKSPFYCLMYGGQVAKFSTTLGVPQTEGKKLFNMFWDRYKPLDMFRKDLERAWEHRGGKRGGFLKGLDGRKLFARSSHALVNLMFQSAGSIVVKTATVFTDEAVEKFGYDSVQVLHFHDEFQRETLKEHTPYVKTICEEAFIKAGKHYNLNVPIEGDVKIGGNWYETH